MRCIPHEKFLEILRVSNPTTRKDLAARTLVCCGTNPKLLVTDSSTRLRDKLVKKRVLKDCTLHAVNYLGSSQSQPEAMRTVMEATNLVRAINQRYSSTTWFSPQDSCYSRIVNMDVTIPDH